MTDYKTRRIMMVDTQVRPSDVTKFPIIEAMLSVPRERFVPDAARETAYMGEHVPLGGGRVVLDPRILAKMLDVLNIQRDELVLDVGCGLGYSAAVISRMAEAVIALEEDESLAHDAEAELSANDADNVAVVTDPLVGGAPKHGPYDVIVIQGGVQIVPDAILAQLKEGGRIGCLYVEGALGTCRVGLKVAGQISWRDTFNATAPVLPGFSRAPAFQL